MNKENEFIIALTFHIANCIGDTGVALLCESLKTNTTLTELCLWSSSKEKRHIDGIYKHLHYTPFALNLQKMTLEKQV